MKGLGISTWSTSFVGAIFFSSLRFGTYLESGGLGGLLKIEEDARLENKGSHGEIAASCPCYASPQLFI